jgi:tetratricopeptide (TPR) repeat protein
LAEGPDREAVDQALASLLDWPEIARSPQLARFLAYIVERRLNGDTQSIKAYSIAVDVFGRPPDFDPQADPIVRVQARRLRSLLDQYYLGPGAKDPLRIQLPVGRYVPDFVEWEVTETALPDTPEAQEAPSATEESVARRRGHVTVSWFVLLVLALGATALIYALSTIGLRQAPQDNQATFAAAMQPPRLRVLEFQNLTGDTSLAPNISALAIELVTDFVPFLVVDVALGGRADSDGAEPDADFSLTGIVRADRDLEGEYQLSAILTDLAVNSIVWNWSMTVSREQLTGRGGIDEIAQELVRRLGGTRGPLHNRARQLLSQGDIEGRENFYLCGVLFSMYRTSNSPGLAERVGACIDGLPEKERESGNVLAAQASLIAEGVASDANALVPEDRLAQADETMDRAIRADPTSSFVWEQRARLDEASGEHDMAEAAYGTSLQINPANMDALAAHARHLALIGQLESGATAAQRALDSVPRTQVPDWYYCAPAIASLSERDYRDALTYAERCAHIDVELGSVLAVLAAQGLGDAALTAQQLPRVLEVPSFRQAGIVTRMKQRGASQALVYRIANGLTRAGVPASSLISPY